jgi:hypothetical protein
VPARGWPISLKNGFASETKDCNLGLGNITKNWVLRTLVILWQRSCKVFARNTWQRAIRVDQHDWPAKAKKIAPHGASYIYKVINFAAIGELSTGNSASDQSGYEDKGANPIPCCAAKNYATMTRLGFEQPSFFFFKTAFNEPICPDNADWFGLSVVGQRQNCGHLPF